MNRALLAAVLVVVLAAASPAAAESPRWGSFELGAMTYRPDIDSEPMTPPDPYASAFGTGRGFMFQFAVSRALFTRMGSLELGLRTGWFRDRGHGFRAGTTIPTEDETTFNVVPTSLSLGYRFDWAADRWNVPFAPYGRVTLERFNWWVTDGSGSWQEQGATNGWSVTGGVAILLDFFDPQLARELDMDTGVNSTYLYVEVTKSTVDDFGSSKSWNLSDEKVSLGFGLLFAF